ncbi:unnamed protein product [Ectocarpus sp. 13 AM-2016]
MEEKVSTNETKVEVEGLGNTSPDLDASAHDGDWNFYKQRTLEQKDVIIEQNDVISRLTGVLKTHGYQLPTDGSSLEVALADDTDPEAPGTAGVQGLKEEVKEDRTPSPSVQAAGILSQGSQFISATSTSSKEKYEQIAKELPQSVGVGCEVRLKGLTYSVQREKGTADEPTVGDEAMACGKCLVCIPCYKTCKHGKEMEAKTILDDVNAVFKPSSTTLVLGPPGCGKSTLLKAVAGLLKEDKGHIVQGRITYNGDTRDSGNFSLPKVAHFAEQADRHVPTMTVNETFSFAFDSMAGGSHGLIFPEGSTALTEEQKTLLKWMDENHFKVEMVMRSLGLYNAKDTIVGNNNVRGVSGGERRRVTMGEMICGPQAMFLLDSISTGLDSSTTFDIMTSLKSTARTFNNTVVVALLQPPPETYELFDNVILMAEGKIIYHGPREDIVPYFNSLGITCPARKDTADWLVELTGEAGASYRSVDIETEKLSPVTPEEFSAKWRASAAGKAMDKAVDTPGENDGTEWPTVYKRKYPGSFLYHQKVCFNKAAMLMLRDKGNVVTQLLSGPLIGAVVGSIFFQLDLDDANAKFGLIFFSLLYLSTNGMNQITPAIKQRGIFYKQSAAGFYPTSCVVIADTLVNTILTIACSMLFAPVVYFLAGFSSSNSGWNFFTFMVIVVMANVNMSQYFRLLAACMPDDTVAGGVSGLSLLLCVLFCGFLIPADNIPGWWIWLFHANPLTWAFRAAVLNEFQTPEYELCVGGAESCELGLGETFIKAYGFARDPLYVWGGIAFLVVEFLACVAVTTLAYHYIHFDNSDSAPLVPTATGEDEKTDKRSAEDAKAFNAPVAQMKRQKSQLDADLPFDPVTLTFRDMSYSVPHPSGEGELTLLNEISGFCKPHEMTALMGSSGAGKTTLLDVLAGRKTGGTTTGDIRVNGHPKRQETFTRRETRAGSIVRVPIAGYVEQQDMHSAVVTVKEALMFSATMRLESSAADADGREKFVDSILSMLELDEIAGRLIGSEASGGLSLEQRKRTTLGVELAANPGLVLLDEPTSGLDARSAQVVMRAIRKVAATGRAVICTIHQPSTYLFEMFDSLLLLKKGGQTVFFGELGAGSSKLISYLSSVPDTPPIRDNVNPATWMLECIGAGTTGKVDPQVYADVYKTSNLKSGTLRELESLMIPPAGSEPLQFSSVYAASRSLQTKTCIDRAILQYWRNPNYNWSRIMLALVIAVIFGTASIGGDLESEADVAAQTGVIYMSTMFVGSICMQTAIAAGFLERIVFYREKAANMYSSLAYAIGYTVAEVPYIFVISLAFCGIFYFIMGLAATAHQFFFYWMFFVLWETFMVFTGMTFVFIIPSFSTAGVFAGTLVSMFSVFAGFLISPAKIPGLWLWAYYLNPLHYIVEVSKHAVQRQRHNH